MFAGEENLSLVLDIGSESFRGGFAGEDLPRAVFPSCVGLLYEDDPSKVGSSMEVAGEEDGKDMSIPVRKRKYFIGTNSLIHRDHMEINRPLEDGLVKDWDTVEHLIDHCVRTVLRADPTAHPMMLTEPAHATRQQREQMCQLAFEKFGCKAFFLAKSPALNCFANGRTTALVLDSGASVTSAVPVHDGYALQKAMVRTSFAGDAISRLVYDQLREQDITVRPLYQLKRRRATQQQQQEESGMQLEVDSTHQSYHQWAVMNIINDLKAHLLRVSEAPIGPEGPKVTGTEEEYQLPDGTTVRLGPKRFTIPETMFTPSTILEKESGRATTSFSDIAAGSVRPFHLMASEAVTKSDSDIRKDLYANVIVTGGNTLINGFARRFERELTAKTPTSFKVRPPVAPASSQERQSSAWIGGSILCSLGTFQQMWVSKAEYDEKGASIVHSKCP